jgi:putative oxidoreductase
MKKIIEAINTVLFMQKDAGLLVFRIIIGGMFMWHGLPKILGGPETWIPLGQTMKVFGIYFAPGFFGFMSGASECFGGLLIFLGLFYRVAAVFLCINLLTAFSSQLLQGKGLFKASQSFEDAASFLAAIFVGPGRYSLDHYLGLDRDK